MAKLNVQALSEYEARRFAEAPDDRFRTDLLLLLLREVTFDREDTHWLAYRDAECTPVGLLCYVNGKNEEDGKIFVLKTMFGAYDAMIHEFFGASDYCERSIHVEQADLLYLPDREERLERWGFECRIYRNDGNPTWIRDPEPRSHVLP